ncbi:MAG TPA: ABC transporter transmembrane domain-containing protein, partial [Acetobacteraceae bacterium]|nr:ABC transporter transmembrane domain-containing protein [Acetobacteraceae bacterium]
MNDMNSASGDASGTESGHHIRIAAVMAVAKFHGAELDPQALRLEAGGDAVPSSPHLVEWLRESGLWARGIRVSWRQLMKMETTSPVILLLKDGGAALMVGHDRERGLAFVRDPRAEQGAPGQGTPGQGAPVAVDELQLQQLWDGGVLLIRGTRDGKEAEPAFNFGLLTRMVMLEKRILRDVALGSITLTILQVLPILMIMVVLNTVIIYKSINTLILVTLVFVIAIVFEALLSWGRRLMLVILSTRLDARLNLMIFDRLMTLPIEFFERNQAGDVTYKIQQIYRVRDFITGRLLSTFIDMFMVALILPILFYLDAFLAWTVLIAAGIIGLIIVAFLGPLARLTGRIIQAESRKGATMVESIYGIRTVKSLGLEPVRAKEWDDRVAETSGLYLQMGRLSNWPMALTLPFERYTQGGVLLLGAYIGITSQNPLALGGLIGFMLLGGRVAGPLVSFARLIQDAQEARAAVGIVGSVLNRPTERRALTTGLRPRFEGAIEFENITFTYEGGK